MTFSNKIVYTIVTEDFLCFAHTLKESFLKHNPSISFFICVISDNEKFSNGDHSGIITTSVLDFEEYTNMKSRYDNLSMVCALKPYFAKYFLDSKDVESIIYLDADIYVYHSCEYLYDLLENDSLKNSIILTPHVTDKLGVDNMVRNINYLTYGTYNAGFFAVKNNEHGREFIDWWKELLFKYCKNDLKYGIFYDQSWLNLVPNYFYSYYTLLLHPGYNVAYWNVDERRITKKDNIYYCKDMPLVFYHFARFDYYNPKISKNIDEINPLMLEVFADYKNHLKNKGFETIFARKNPTIKQKISFLSKIKRFLKSQK